MSETTLETAPRVAAFAPEDSAPSHNGTGMTIDAPVIPDLDEHLVSVHSPYSFEADQYRILRHFLEPRSGAARRQVLGITSPTAGDGKTTTAVNLAVTLGQLPGARVLLIDGDVRRPFVAARLGLAGDRRPGLAATALDPHLDLDTLVRRTSFNLDVVPAGAPTTNAYRVFDSERVGQLLEQARRTYDHVVVDTPPVLLVPDCRFISQWVDGFLIVVAAHRTPRKLVADALSAVGEDKTLGIVFNGDDRPLSGHFGKYQGYYGYYQQSANRQRSWWRFPWRRAAKGRPQR